MSDSIEYCDKCKNNVGCHLNRGCLQLEGLCPPDTTPRSALVTRYPTGCFGIDYNGSMFQWWGFVEAEVHVELERLCIPAKRVKWEEHYYDTRYHFNDPRSYKTREYIPQDAESIHPEPKP